MRVAAGGASEIESLAEDVNAMAASLERLDASRKRWIAQSAHELRTPLMVLRGEIEALQDGVRPTDSRALASLAEEVSHLARLVEDLHLVAVADMGITNRFFPTENAPNGSAALLAAFDRVADPEDVIDPATGRGDVDALADFMRLLAPPVRLQANPSARAGEALFASIGCANCHVPSMTTGLNAIAAFDWKPVALHSDLLLHDMGSLADGIAQAAAGPREIKTPPLWGLRASAPYLHDGRAPTIDEANRQHDGEALSVRGRYEGLNPQQRQQILDFLRTL